MWLPSRQSRTVLKRPSEPFAGLNVAPSARAVVEQPCGGDKVQLKQSMKYD
jgi:hypothetical protein